MWYREDIKDFLDNSMKLTSCNAIYLTDLENVLYVGSKDNTDTEETPQCISKELLIELLKVNINDGSEQIFIHNKQIVPLFDDITKTIQWKFQMILPVMVNDKVSGALVFGNDKEINENHIKFAKTTLKFVEDFILEGFNQQFLLRDMDSINIDTFFCDDNLEQVNDLLEYNHEVMDREEVYTDTQEKLYYLSEYFDKILSKEDKEKFHQFEKYMQKQSECESYLAFQIGLKKGVQINNLIVR